MADGQPLKNVNDIVGSLVIVVLGASGDLAKKKTFPALFNLFCQDLLPKHAFIVGYARSHLEMSDFKSSIAVHFRPKKEDEPYVLPFLDRCYYLSGQYDSDKDFSRLNTFLLDLEHNSGRGNQAHRLFYMALPPSVYSTVGKHIKSNIFSSTGWNRIIIEKPFGRDLQSSTELARSLGNIFTEDQTFRIDHYLGKEMVQNLLVLRFANVVFSPNWNHNFIANVQITFKEDIGTAGRGGYFDEFGIIRDVMQNHLMQLLTLVAMERPVSLDAEDVRDEKVKVLRCIKPITLEDTVLGQYTASPDGKIVGYLDDKTVPKNSITPTFAVCVLHINNERWEGVPFILKCGKALNERKTEIRIQLRTPPGSLFPGVARNEIVMRVQPDEAIYMKLTAKVPGLSNDITQTELDLTFHERYKQTRLPDAYERLIHDVLRGDHRDFVRNDELQAAWHIFTPILHHIERESVKPLPYPFGSRGPAAADELVRMYGYERRDDYQWTKKTC